MKKKTSDAFAEEALKSINTYLQGLENILKSKMVQLTPDDRKKFGKLGK